MESVECLVVGAGVIGLAVARALARAGREVIVVERESGIGAGVSSRNSEVIHAGIYYRTGLDKTRLCVDGKAMLYAFCQAYGVPHKRCGKFLVAVNAGEIGKLTAINAQAEANGVTDLVWLSGEEARALEPALVAERALLSPSTGIIDTHAFMLALRGDAEAHGAMFAFETPVLAGRISGQGLVIEVGGPAPLRLAAGLVVNAAGLSAQALARSIDRWHASR
jgi:L-2-hydroxyglutarate oxidase LhgO